MNEHPIEGLMNTAMENLKDMIDVDTVIGEAIELDNGTAIIPISKVCFGFAAGGSEWSSAAIEQSKKQGIDEEHKYTLPFGGGSGAGANITPLGFLVVTDDSAKMIPIDHSCALDKLLDYVPDLLDKLSDFLPKEKIYKCKIYDADGCECECNCEAEE